jgi:hypothetical protein
MMWKGHGMGRRERKRGKGGDGTYLTALAIDMPLARISSGNTSADTTHASGPHVTAKFAMYQ